VTTYEIMKSLINLRILLFCSLSLSLISWDRVSKDLAKEYLRNKPAQTFLHGGFRLEYVENTGAAMSLADNLHPRLSFWLLGILPLTILLGLFVYMIVHNRNIRTSRLMALSLIFAGGMGNIVDRLLFDRHVTDFMNIGVVFLRAGIFNFADVWITAGVAWVTLDAVRKRQWLG
jgi:signal peptidase II